MILDLDTQFDIQQMYYKYNQNNFETISISNEEIFGVFLVCM